MISRGTYVGPDNRLHGKVAVIKPVPTNLDIVKVRFDDYPINGLTGWHHFPRDDFRIDRNIDL